MTEKAFRAIQSTLHTRWDLKLPNILASARNVSSAALARIRQASASTREAEIDRALRDAYSTGYRQAYWDGVMDILEAGTEVETPADVGTALHH